MAHNEGDPANGSSTTAGDGLLAKMTAEATWHLTEPEMDYLLDRARDNRARGTEHTLIEVAAAMRQAFEAGHLTIQAGPEFAIVTMYGRVLAVMRRHDLRGLCHPSATDRPWYRLSFPLSLLPKWECSRWRP